LENSWLNASNKHHLHPNRLSQRPIDQAHGTIQGRNGTDKLILLLNGQGKDVTLLQPGSNDWFAEFRFGSAPGGGKTAEPENLNSGH